MRYLIIKVTDLYMKRFGFFTVLICLPLCLLSTGTHTRPKMPFTVTKNEGVEGKGIVLTPPNAEYSNVVIWMHGLGDTADGWAEDMPHLNIPNTKFILPTASTIPISINGGSKMTGWFDIEDLDESAPEDRAGFAASMRRINTIIDHEINVKNISPSKIIIAGFSQGGALAAHTSLRRSAPLGGCIILSAWLPFRNDYTDSSLDTSFTVPPTFATFPILQFHGTMDNVVPFKWGEHSSQLIKQLVPVAEFVTIRGMAHSSTAEEMNTIKKFIMKIFEL